MLANLNYDLNIWDWGMYNTCHLSEDEQFSQWKISVHNLQQLADGSIQCGDWIEDIDIFITDEEAKQLTLGVSEEDGGYYSQDEDFFMDIDAFFTIYPDIPDRIKNALLTLPPIDIEQTDW